MWNGLNENTDLTTVALTCHLSYQRPWRNSIKKCGWLLPSHHTFHTRKDVDTSSSYRLRAGVFDPCIRAVFKFGQRVHFALRSKMHRPPISSDLTGLNKLLKWRGGLNLWSKTQVVLDTALVDFNPGQFKTRAKRMAAQVAFCLSLNAFLSRVQNGTWKLAHVCPIKFLITYLIQFIWRQSCAKHMGPWEA